MAQWDKLLSKIKSLDKDMRFAELKKVLQSYGYSGNCRIRRKKQGGLI